MTSDSNPVGFFKLDATDEIVVVVGGVNKTVKTGEFKDRKGRAPNYMIELLDGDRFFHVTEKAAREFMLLHGMTEVDDEEMEKLRVKDEQAE
jgi:hypothetical protein